MMEKAKSPAKSREYSVLIAYEPGDVGRELKTMMGSLGYRVETATDGDQAWVLLRSHPFELLLVDAGLPGKPSYELCNGIKTSDLDTKVVLIASVYRKTRYKRSPKSLYGAHDYIEQHHIHDKLPDKIAALFGRAHPCTTKPGADPEKIRRAGDLRINPSGSTVEFDKTRLKRLARILASDMAVYNPELLKTGFKDFTQQEMEDLSDGQSFFRRLVPMDRAHAEKLLLEALEFLKTGKQKTGDKQGEKAKP